MSSNPENIFTSDAPSTALMFVSDGTGLKLKAFQYVAIDGHARVEGCIDLGPVAEVEQNNETLRKNVSALMAGTLEPKGAGMRALRYRWPKGIVPYTIADELPNQQRVIDAIKEWESRTHIRFPKRTATDVNYITFAPGSGCSSNIGMQGKQQFITLGDACTTGNCIHEIGHALGLWHEQSRVDRDLYVRVLLQNVMPGKEFNFSQYTADEGLDLGSYDYGSIMHYPANAFSKNGKPTIEPVIPHDIGQRDHLSAGDIQAIGELYPV